MNYYEQKGDDAKCIKYAEKYLTEDPYDEKKYVKLMELYAKAGNKAMALKTFERCKNSIEKDLDCPVSEETMNTYRQLFGLKISQ